jgi:hypothetical protein
MKKSLRPMSRSSVEQEGSTRSPTGLYVGQDDMRSKGMFKNTTNNLTSSKRPKARPATSKKSNVGPSGMSSRGFTELGE